MKCLNDQYLVPFYPTEDMWNGLARTMVRYMQCKDRYCPKSLGVYLKRFMKVPEWLDDEIASFYGGWECDHAFATADMGVLIYQAMLKGSEGV